MRRFALTLLLILVVCAGCWAIANRERIKSPSDLLILAKEDLQSLNLPLFQSSSSFPVATGTSNSESGETIRIAAFKLNGDTRAAQQPNALPLLTEICRRFDLIALQEVTSQNPEWVSNLQASLKSATGHEFGYFASSPVNDRQFAVLYNMNTLHLDQSHFYTVNDPDQLFERPPLVGWFRARAPHFSEAFTFSLVNMQIDSDRSGQELQQIGNLYRSVRDDGRQEDDVIMIGDFQAGSQAMGLIKKDSGLESLVQKLNTNTLQTAQFDNLLISPVATVEYSGAAGVFDFMQHFNLYLNDSLAISEHLPVWAEFSIFEGHQSKKIASATNPAFSY